MLFGSGLLFVPCCDLSLAQEKERKKFGSSLKRLKWDKSKEVAIDKDSGKEAARNRPVSTNDPNVIRIETSLVTFDLLVTDQQGFAIKGLTKEDFVVKEDGVEQQVNMFSLGDDALLPRSIVLIFDHSGSQIPYLQMSIDAAKNLVEQLKPNDKMAIVNDNVELLQDFTNDKKQLKLVLNSIRKQLFGFTSLSRSQQYSALFAVLQELLIEAERPIIIFQTDGDQRAFLQPITQELRRGNRASFGIADLITAALRERVTIYSVIPGIRLMGFSFTEQLERARQILKNHFRETDSYIKDAKQLERNTESLLHWQETLAELAATTGGWHEFLERPEQAAVIYERILTDMNRRYIIGYYPTNEAKDGALRKVRFEVRGHPEYIIRGRQSYYARHP